MKMKIGIVLPASPGYSETFFTNKIKGLQHCGYEVILFVNTVTTSNAVGCKIKKAPNLSGNFFKVFGVSLFLLTRTWLFHFKTAYTLFRSDKKDGLSIGACFKSSIVNSHILSESLDWLYFGFGTMALGRENVAATIGAKMAVSFRGYDYYVYPQKNKDCYKILWTKKVKYHVLSEAMATGVKQNGIQNSKVVKITPAIDTQLFKPLPKKDNATIQLLTIARLHWIKGLESTLEALALLCQSGIDFQYTIIGEGGEKERLLFAAHQLGIADKVVFKGRLDPEAVKSVLQQTDVYLQYSLQEGFGNAVLEAQAMGVLCIVSDAEGLSENVSDRQTGFVVPKANPNALAQKIKEVVALSDDVKQRMQKQAIQRVQQEFNLAKQEQEWLTFYEII